MNGEYIILIGGLWIISQRSISIDAINPSPNTVDPHFVEKNMNTDQSQIQNVGGHNMDGIQASAYPTALSQNAMYPYVQQQQYDQFKNVLENRILPPHASSSPLAKLLTHDRISSVCELLFQVANKEGKLYDRSLSAINTPREVYVKQSVTTPTGSI